jgi:hypothetical protein
MQSGFTYFSGRRGQILWTKPNLLGGGGRRDYDVHEAVGFLAPIMVLAPLHASFWGSQGDGQAIRLNPERGFRLRAFLGDWCMLSLFISPVAAIAFGMFAALRMVEQDRPSGVLVFLTILSLAVPVAAIAVLVWLRRSDRRDRDIRLVLGTHTWGSSDPATWHPDLLDEVRPAHTFRVKNFAALARRSLTARKWCEAMWAARLCTALEDEDAGEDLTSEILDEPAVRQKLSKLQKDGSRRDKLFGEPPPLSTWVGGIPEEHVFSVRA